MSYNRPSQTLAKQSLSAQPILERVSPAKQRKMENIMRGMSQHGITQIGFGNNAQTVDVNDLHPMVTIYIYLRIIKFNICHFIHIYTYFDIDCITFNKNRKSLNQSLRRKILTNMLHSWQVIVTKHLKKFI